MTPRTLFCSTIIATVGRPSLARAVRSVLDQRLEADFELLVVNDSGAPLAADDWRQDRRVRVVTTQRRERSVARNTGAAMARGRYLHFLDDDDWLAPGALAHFWRQEQREGVGWYYGASQLVDRAGKPAIELRHGLQGNAFLAVMAGEWIPLQASLICAGAFFDVGGFNPLLAGPEDIDLLRRVAQNYDIAEVEEVVAFIARGEQGSTTDYEGHAQQSRWAREGILDDAATFARLQQQANDAYWRGRLVRLYLTSMAWNLRRGRALAAASRQIQAMRALVAGGGQAFSPAFWRSLARAYQSPTFARGQAARTERGAAQP